MLSHVAGGQNWGLLTDDNLNDFKQLRASVPADQKSCIHCSAQTLKRRFSGWWTSLLRRAILTVDEVKGFLKQMDEEEFDDIELDPIALSHCWWAR